MDWDIESWDKALQLVGQGAKAADGTLNLAKRAKELFSTPKPDERRAELEAVIVDLIGQITEAKLANVNLKEQLIALRENALAKAKKESELEPYELWKTPAGRLLYRLKPEHQEAGVPPHYVCTNCADGGEKSILQGNEVWVECPKCKTGYPIVQQSRPSRARMSTSWMSE